MKPDDPIRGARKHRGSDYGCGARRAQTLFAFIGAGCCAIAS